jgi:hypothetical protein
LGFSNGENAIRNKYWVSQTEETPWEIKIDFRNLAETVFSKNSLPQPAK